MADLDATIRAGLDAIRPEGEVVDAGDAGTPDEGIATGDTDTVVIDGSSDEPEVPAAEDVKDVPAPVVEKKVETPVAVDEDDFSKIPEKDAQGRTNRIPHTRVKKMVETAGKKAVETFTKTTHEPLVNEVNVYRDRFAKIEQVEQTMFNKPPQMLDILLTIPGYKEELERRFGTAAGGGEAARAGADDPEPGPDVKNADGTPAGYSQEGLKALRDWDRRQAVKLAEERLGSRIKPFEDREKTAQQQREEQARRGAGVANELEQATKWDNFVENAEEILKVITEDNNQAMAAERARRGTGKLKHTLLSAYHQVVHAKMSADRARVREEILKEMQTAPKSTAAGGAGAVSRQAAGAKGRTLDEEIKFRLDQKRRTA
jgi:hypothetical protein